MPTDAERRLWLRLRGKQVGEARFRRQHPIGPYVVDFCCLERRLVVEVDGGQHAQRAAADAARTRWLERAGYRVIRFWNNDALKHTDAVVQAIADAFAGVADGPATSPLEGEVDAERRVGGEMEGSAHVR